MVYYGIVYMDTCHLLLACSIKEVNNEDLLEKDPHPLSLAYFNKREM
jgi:hypothetical protein